jgi:sn-glycerol 3-phosphate transport system permease protein
MTLADRLRAWRGHVVLGLVGLACVFPIYWMYATALRRPGDVFDTGVVPWPVSLQSFGLAARQLDIVGLLGNTALMAVGVALGQLLVALLAAYAFAAWRFRGEKLLYLAMIGTWLVPFQVTMLPNYVLLYQLGLLNTLAGVVLPQLLSGVAVLLLRAHMRSVPAELLEAARMDGRGSWGTLWTVVVPVLRPAIAALAILLFVTAWNEYFWPAMVLQRSGAVIQLGIRGFLGTEGVQWGPLMAASGLACLPVFALYLVLQRQVVSAFVRSGLR